MIVAVVGVEMGVRLRFIISSSGAREDWTNFVISYGFAETATVQLMELVAEKLRPGSCLLSFT